MSAVRAALVPGALALLPEYAGQLDPVAQLREACRGAVADLVSSDPRRVVVVACPVRPDDAARGVVEPAGHRVARHLLAQAKYDGTVVDADELDEPGPDDAVLLVGSGSACRSEKAPGHLDERAVGLDDALARTVRDGAPAPDDAALAEELWCFDLPVFQQLPALVQGAADVRYADDPYGVAYWVATWGALRGVGA